MKKLLGTMLCVLMCALCFSQENFKEIKGKVIDAKSQLTIENATVTCQEKSVITKADGSFIFKINTTKSNIQIIVSHVGYKKFTTTINGKNDFLNIEIFPIESTLETLEISSIRANNKAPFAKTNLTKEDIEKTNQGQDIPFALNQTPSVVINTDAGNGVGYTGIRIRGTDASRINVTLNGVPFNDAESQGSFFVNMPDMLSSVTSMQIQRGVGTSSNGTGAFGATINLATNDVINKNASVELNNSFGSFNTFKNTVKASSGLVNNKFIVDARLSQITSDGYIERASSNLKAFALTGTYIAENSSLKMNIFSGKEKTYQAWNGVDEETIKTNRRFNSSGTDKPGSPYNNETDNYNQTHYQLFYNKSINNNWSYNVAGFYTRGFGYYENYRKAQAYSNYGLSSSVDTANLITQLWLDNHFYGSIFSAQYKNQKSTLNFGGSYTNYNGKHYGFVIWSEKGGFEPSNKYYDLKANKWERSAYIKLQHQLNKNITLYTDVQYRFVEHDMPGFRKNTSLMVNRKFNFINPKIGFTYEKNLHQFFISYANASKEPNRDDFETNPTEQPKAENLHDIELGFSTKNKKASLQLNAYGMLYKSQLIVTGKVNDVGNLIRFNVDNSYRIGLELNGSYKFNNWLQFNGNIAISQNKIKSYKQIYYTYDANWNWSGQVEKEYNNTTIAMSPSIVSSNNFNIAINKNLDVQLVGKYVDKQYLDNTQTESRSLEAFYTQDVKAFFKLNNKLFKETLLILSLNNIFNKMYSPNGACYPAIVAGDTYNYNYYYPAAGFNFMVSCNMKL